MFACPDLDIVECLRHNHLYKYDQPDSDSDCDLDSSEDESSSEIKEQNSSFAPPPLELDLSKLNPDKFPIKDSIPPESTGEPKAADCGKTRRRKILESSPSKEESKGDQSEGKEKDSALKETISSKVRRGRKMSGIGHAG